MNCIETDVYSIENRREKSPILELSAVLLMTASRFAKTYRYQQK